MTKKLRGRFTRSSFSLLPRTSSLYIIPRDSPSFLSSIHSWSDIYTGARTRRLSCTSQRGRLRATFIDQTERTFSLIRTIEPDGSSKPKHNYLCNNTRQPLYAILFCRFVHASFPTTFVSQRTPLSCFYVSNDVNTWDDFSLTKKDK